RSVSAGGGGPRPGPRPGPGVRRRTYRVVGPGFFGPGPGGDVPVGPQAWIGGDHRVSRQAGDLPNRSDLASGWGSVGVIQLRRRAALVRLGVRFGRSERLSRWPIVAQVAASFVVVAALLVSVGVWNVVTER